MSARRDWFYVELVFLLGTLIAGAVLRFWLSTVLPFDPAEREVLVEAALVDRGLRVAFIMLNGASLFALYLLVRRSAGVPAAFVVLLALQTSLSFQEQALRVRPWAMAILPIMVLAAYVRFQRPPWRLPRTWARPLLAVVALLMAKGTYLLVTLPARMDAIREGAPADPHALLHAAERCGGGVVTPAEQFRRCEIPWPTSRSLDQQEVMFAHRYRLGQDASVIDGADSHAPADGTVVVFDPAAAVFIAVPEGALAESTIQVVRSAAPDFFAAEG